MSEPCISGIGIMPAVQDTLDLVERGLISQEELESRLEPSDLKILSHKIEVTGWYSLRSYDRMLQVLGDVEGQGDPQYLFFRGNRTASRLIDQGLYQQMEYLSRMQVSRAKTRAERMTAFDTDLRLLLTLTTTMINFGDWQAIIDPDHGDRYRILVTDTQDVPDSFWHSAEGFLSKMCTHARPTLPERYFRYQRDSDDGVSFHMATGIDAF